MYTYTWKKYLPLVRLLLKRSANGAQTVRLDKLDFNKSPNKTKTTSSFKIDIERGKLLTVSASVPARQFYDAILEDDIARQLIGENKYHISLNADFDLVITNQSSLSLP